jgi:IS6 family transposase
VILLAVRWYLRYGLSYRDLEALFAERGIEVDHVTLYRWVQRFTPLLIEAAWPCRHVAGDRWFVDETHVKVCGVWRYVYRAVDQKGQVFDVYVSQCRDIASARTFFTAALTVHGIPTEVITDRAGLGERDRGLDSCCVAQHRPVPEQPCRERPWPTEGQAQADARTEGRCVD